MKKFLIILISLLLSTSAFALQSPWDYKLPFKEATLIYKLSGSMKGGSLNGKLVTYVKDYGKLVAVYEDTTGSFMGMSKTDRTLTISDKNWEYRIDLNSNTGKKYKNPDIFYNQIFYKLSKSQQQKIINIINKYGWGIVDAKDSTVKKKVTKIYGYWCDLITETTYEEGFGKSTVQLYTIHNTPVPLKMIYTQEGVSGKMNHIVTSFKKKAPSSKFKLPNINFVYDKSEDQENLQEARDTINRLLSMGAPKKQVHTQKVQPKPQVETGTYYFDDQQLQELLLLLMEAIDMPQVSESKQQKMTLMMQKIQTHEITPHEQYQTVQLLNSINLTPEQKQQLQDILDMF